MIGVINDNQNTEFLPENLKHAHRLGNPDGREEDNITNLHKYMKIG